MSVSGQAPGYPAQPDHTEKQTIFDLLAAERRYRGFPHRKLCDAAGIFGQRPLFSRTRTRIISASAKVERDQVEDYATREWMSVAEVERWLAPVLNYVPIRAAAAE